MNPVYTFLTILAWLALGWCLLVIFAVTVLRAVQTETDELFDKIQGRTYRPRVPYAIGAAVAAAWLYAVGGLP